MSLHGLRSVTIGVPDVEKTASFYEEFGLRREDGGVLRSVDGGDQLALVHRTIRQLVELRIAADDLDDLLAIRSRLSAMSVPAQLDGVLRAVEPLTGTSIVVEVAPRLRQPMIPRTYYNGPGRIERPTIRADVNDRSGQVRPLKLGHVVLATPHWEQVRTFFVSGIGFKVSDEIRGEAAFLRCSQDHHNLLVTNGPVTFMHHTSWQVRDTDEIGRGATRLLEVDPARHVWGFGRHCVGSNFFWYLRDPAGNFAEYYSDMDVIVDDALWKPDVFEGARGLYLWGPPPPPSFIRPDDLAELMAGAHRS